MLQSKKTQNGLSPRPGKTTSSLQKTITVLYLAIVFTMGTLVIMFFSGTLVVGGVPSSIILRFLQDDIARSAYLSGDKKRLHDRLNDLGVEEQIKAYYRPSIPDEIELDQHIHQVLYDRTGYVGENYQVDAQGKLVLKQFTP